MRLEDESLPVRDAVPAEYADVVVVITEFGGPSVLLILLAILFWCGHRPRTALVVSYAVAGLGFILALESLLGLPRPPESVRPIPIDVEGYGFPSGHAFAATVVYGGLVSAYDRLRDPLAVAGVTIVIVAISLSRVVLGVHYLGDVIAGAALGVVFVAAMNRLTRGSPLVGFGIAVVAAIPAVYLSPMTTYAILALGGAIGGLLTAGSIDRLPDLQSRLEALVLVVVGCGVVFGLRALEPIITFDPLLVALYAVLVAWVIFAPAVIGTVRRGLLESSTR